MNIYLLKNKMKREEIEQKIQDVQNNIKASQEYLKSLQEMTPDEDKSVVMSRYSVYYNDWVLCVDQWLDAHSEQETHESVDKKLCTIQSASPHTYKVMVFEAPIRIEVKQSSYPF